MDAGLDNVLQLCRTAGIRSQLRQFPATFLGSSEITLAELASAYTIFPNGGWRPNAPHILEQIEEKDGTVWHAQGEHSARQDVIKPETAYEVHSCLVDALESGTGKDAHKKFGLKKIPVAGKTGTAYDFTDALFAGYSSRITCAVWAGFDKPQKIYRGAFGRELALPVWVDVMNASVERYAPKEIAPPPGLKKIEICSRSGLLATDKCYDAVKTSSGDTVQRRTTYEEFATEAQAPKEPCNVHGEPRARLAHDLPAAEFPRASLAVDLNDVRPVLIKAPTLLADKDPYNYARPSVKAPAETERVAADKPEEKKNDNGIDEQNLPRPERVEEPPVRSTQTIPDPASVPKNIPKAIPVKPEEPEPEETPVEIRKAVPVGPLDEIKDGTLLQSATPPPDGGDE
jgi:penicillin-binding protein 1A